jgi:hypothetical protein
LRNLQETDDDDEEEDSDESNEEGSSIGNITYPEETLPTTPKETRKKYADVQIIDFNSFIQI